MSRTLRMVRRGLGTTTSSERTPSESGRRRQLTRGPREPFSGACTKTSRMAVRNRSEWLYENLRNPQCAAEGLHPEREGITAGIVCLISAVEPCMSFQVRKRNESGRIEMFRRERRCLHHYLYLIDDEFGFMHVRLQGWIPYECQIYINGRVRHEAPWNPSGDERAPPPGCRSSLVKLRAA